MRLPRFHRSAGIAIVTVLFVIVLVFGLIVAFLNMVKTERASTASFLSATEVRQLAHTTMGIVQAQINNAAAQGGSNAWVSQPGMVRTYQSGGAFGTAYKLYSATTLTTTDPSSISTDDLPPANWADEKAVWTDLNSPVTVITTSGTSYSFPIIDGNGVKPLTQTLSGNTTASYLGYDSNADGTPDIGGFSIDPAKVQYNPALTLSSTNTPVSMPVRWLYVLKDGSVHPPTIPSGGAGNTIIIPAASGTNPIVGRIAFWTDDETCKVNVNTAGVGTSGSSYWDTPHFSTVEERKFGSSQPLNGEFQRYPGHPAMTSLKPIFPSLSDDEILDTITPRYQSGGSKQGTVDTYNETNALANGAIANKPLISSVDEISFISTKTSRADNPNVDRPAIEAAKFFITANSHAPELNLLNLPRIACWPLSTNPNSRTPFDKVISFCSSITGTNGLTPYYFTRNRALSPTDDVGGRNLQLFSYLQHLTNKNIPGFGVSLANKFDIDRDQILTEIWDYIRCTNLYDSRLSPPLAPSGSQFTAVLGNENASTAGFGYVVPLDINIPGTSTRGFGRALTISELAFHFICTADSVDPAIAPAVPNPKGLLGSNDVEKNLTLSGTLKIADKERRIQMMITPEFFFPSIGNVLVSPKNTRIQIKGLNSMRLNTNVLFDNDSGTVALDSFNGATHARRIGGANDYRGILVKRCAPTGISPDNGTGLNSAKIYPFISKYVTVAASSTNVTVSGTTYLEPAMTFNPGTLTAIIETSVDGTNWTQAQEIPLTDPATTPPAAIPIPTLVLKGGPGDTDPGTASPQTDEKYWWAFSSKRPWADVEGYGRLYGAAGTPSTWTYPPPLVSTGTTTSGSLIRGGADVVRTIAPSHGDYRLIAALKKVPQGTFTPLGYWSTLDQPLIHTLGVGLQESRYVPGGSQYRRHFVTDNPIGQGTTYGPGGYTPPDFRRDATTAIKDTAKKNGDFDNAVSFWPDGAYINKPDEGNIFDEGTAVPYFDTQRLEIDSKSFFSPNRIIPGPGMLGSLPTHIKRYEADPSQPQNYAWTTLLFRNQPHPNHTNAVTWNNGLPTAAPDHLLMDLFWMPTVQPYAISEPFATAGKINMNYEIQPFNHITRKTGLHAALTNEKLPAIPNADYRTYKYSNGLNNSHTYRRPLDIDATLSQFENRFNTAKISGRIFISPTELCDIWLVPLDTTLTPGQPPSDTAMKTYWDNHNLTGDNMRERPYTTIIPRLTTKSNTYTIHLRVQTLKPSTATPNQWDETRSHLAEYRGSTTIERFIDPNAPIPDYADGQDPWTSNKDPIDKSYRWRVIENRQFCP